MTEIEIIQKLGDRIQSIRNDRNMTQLDLSVACNIEQPALARIEKGKTNPTTKTLFKISKALEIDIRDLFSFLDDYPNYS